MLVLTLFTAVVLLGISFLLSLWWTLFAQVPVALRPSHRRGPLKVCTVLGSGGHTSEMMRLIRSLPTRYWADNRPCFVVSATDLHSAAVAQEQERRLYGRDAIVHVIPRAREVGQSYASSILTTLRALGKSFGVVLEEKPDVLLVNGPGVCVPIVVASLLLAVLLPWRLRRPAILYAESFTCVRHVSLTGRLLAPFIADVFTVHWRSLLPVVRALRWDRTAGGWGGLYYLGCSESDDNGDAERVQRGVGDIEKSAAAASPVHQEDGKGCASRPNAPTHVSEPLGGTRYALVTVGSTRFDKLVRAMSTETVCRTLRERFGITCLLLQYGTSDFTLPAARAHPASCADGKRSADGSQGLLAGDGGRGADSREASPAPSEVQAGVCAGVTMQAFRYRSNLSRWVQRAALVVTHAGAGTILECLQAQVPTVVVPNRDLMSDHQLELAEALAERKHLFYMSVEDVATGLAQLDTGRLRPHGGIDKDALRRVMAVPLTGRPAKGMKSVPNAM